MLDFNASRNLSAAGSVAPASVETWREVAAFLAKPAAYPDDGRSLEVRETHISRVFLTKRFAYKLKKPVRFDFLDFSTAALRKEVCESEVRLNRRLAPDVYLRVIPVSRAVDGRLMLGGSGQPVEWLVKMRRLDDQLSLERMILDGRADHALLDPLAKRLATFYAGQAPVVLRSSDFRQRLISHIDGDCRNLTELLPGMEEAVARVHSLQQRYVRLLADMFDNRVCDGRVVDGHGDLRPDHIYLEAAPVIIDCVEFSSEYRCNDIIDELAFLAMECDRLGADWVGETLFTTYCRHARDAARPSLMDFYKCYRACVRAKVAGLTSRQQGQPADSPLTMRYLELAGQYGEALGPPIVVIVGGLMGVGKSTLAERLALECRAPLLQTDAIRQQTSGPSDGAQGYGQGLYQEDRRLDVYREMMVRAEAALRRDAIVILDGSFSRESMRRLAQRLAKDQGAELIQIQCECDDDVAMARMRRRAASGHSPSEARPELLAAQRAEYQPPLNEAPLLKIDTRADLSAQWDLARRRLAESLP